MDWKKIFKTRWTMKREEAEAEARSRGASEHEVTAAGDAAEKQARKKAVGASSLGGMGR